MRASAKTLSTELANCQWKNKTQKKKKNNKKIRGKCEKRHYQTVAINL